MVDNVKVIWNVKWIKVLILSNKFRSVTQAKIETNKSMQIELEANLTCRGTQSTKQEQTTTKEVLMQPSHCGCYSKGMFPLVILNRTNDLKQQQGSPIVE